MNILFILHSSPTANIRGGVEEHINDLINNDKFTKNFEKIYLLFPSQQLTQIHNSYSLVQVKTSQIKTTKIIRITNEVTKLSYKNSELSSHLKKIILAASIDIVHAHHILSYPLNIPLIVKQSGAKLVISIHDYFLICPQFNFIDYKNQFCDYPNVSQTQCDICLKHTHKLMSSSQLRRQVLISELFVAPDLIHYVSSDLQKRFHSAYPHIQAKLQLVMGVGINPYLFPKSEPIKVKSKVINIGFIGNFTLNKGAENILDVLEYFIENRSQFNLRFYVIGDIREEYTERVYLLSKRFPDFIKVFGSYKKSYLSQILKALDIHVAVLASIWPETFLITLSEIFSTSIVPIVPNLGAPKDRVKNDHTGLIYQYNDVGSLIAKIKICSDISIIESISKNIFNDAKYPLLEDNIVEYLSLYKTILHQEGHTMARRNGLNYEGISIRVLEDNRPYEWGFPIPGYESLHRSSSLTKVRHLIKENIHLYGFRATLKKSISFLFRKVLKA